MILPRVSSKRYLTICVPTQQVPEVKPLKMRMVQPLHRLYCVWGEKVTRMLSSLVNRYLNEGEAMLKDTNIWVCTTCGFVYIGDTPPELCPVCKVPDWKFEKIEGRA